MAGAPKSSNMLEAHKKALKQLDGKSVEAGWFESARYAPNGEGDPGIPVATIARQNEFGKVIEHPGGTKYINDAVVGGRYVGTRFVSQDFAGEHQTTKAHEIVIPARPFMRLAWSNFLNQKATMQKKMAKDIMSGKKTADQCLIDIGHLLEGFIAKAIVNGGWTPNAQSTIQKKGFDKPLVHDSIMLGSVTSQVGKRE